jgi:molybdopterin-guanine dinucleotide biosynthesis protein A
MKFSAVILAGGKSSRMGRDKAGLPLEGRTLLERQAELVRSLQPVELFLSGGAKDHSLADGQLLRDNFANRGPLAGIEAALTLYDMCKAVDKTMRIENVRVVAKTKL